MLWGELSLEELININLYQKNDLNFLLSMRIIKSYQTITLVVCMRRYQNLCYFNKEQLVPN